MRPNRVEPTRRGDYRLDLEPDWSWIITAPDDTTVPNEAIDLASAREAARRHAGERS